MSDMERLQSEVDKLREELEQHRQRELADLKDQLAQAQTAAAHYRAEAERNAELGRQIHREMQAEIDKLRGKLDSQVIQNGRPRN